MSQQSGQIPLSWDKMSIDQLQIYAQEVRQLYEKEQQLRQQLEEQKEVLERKVRELSALNRMFQQYLSTKFQTEAAYQEIIDEMHRAVEKADQLLAQARSQPPPPAEQNQPEPPA